MNKVFQSFLLVFLAIAAAALSAANAAMPRTISFQGKLTDDAGSPLTGSYMLTFKMYTTVTDGTALWSEIHENVSVQNGLYSVELGTGPGTPLTMAFNVPYWLEVMVNSETLSPRHKLTSSPYSMVASDLVDNSYWLNLTTGGYTTLHSHAGGSPGPHGSSHRWNGGADPLPDNAINSAMLDTDSVTSSDIANGTIATIDIANGAITGGVNGKIAGSTIVNSNIALGTISGDRIAASTITASNIAPNTITSDRIKDSEVKTADIEAGAITSDKIQNDGVTADKVQFNYAASNSEGGAATSLANGNFNLLASTMTLYNLTVASVVAAGVYYGDGSKLSGVAGAGDMKTSDYDTNSNLIADKAESLTGVVFSSETTGVSLNGTPVSLISATITLRSIDAKVKISGSVVFTSVSTSDVEYYATIRRGDTNDLITFREFTTNNNESHTLSFVYIDSPGTSPVTYHLTGWVTTTGANPSAFARTILLEQVY